jgi:flagellar biosynthesis/type III secretory pathway M-ring protein FliF/YscJ
VAVVVDASAHPNLRAVRRTVAAAMGLVLARGDRLSVVSVPMAIPVTASRTVPSWPARVTPYLPSGTAVIVALVCAVAMMAPRQVRKRSSKAVSA